MHQARCVGRTDTWHQQLGADVLESLWGAEVAEPVRLQVQAKRYLVTRHPHYQAKLSPSSLITLSIQGGEMTLDEYRIFEANPHHKAALLLQVWDDHAQQPGWMPASQREALAQLKDLMHQVQMHDAKPSVETGQFNEELRQPGLQPVELLRVQARA